MFKAAKLILPQQKYNKNNRIDLFDRVNWLNSAERFEFYSLVYVHKHVSKNTSLTKSLQQFFVKIPESDRSMRNTACFTLPRMNSKYGKDSFFYQTIKRWNYLPAEVRQCESTVMFENKIRDLLLKCRSDEFVTLEHAKIINCNM
jgi:hypothetical protein